MNKDNDFITMKDTEILKKAYEDVIWMAIRYAHGRLTYAPSMVRDSIKNFQKVFPSWKPKHDITLKLDRERMEEYYTEKGENALQFDADWLDDLIEDNVQDDRQDLDISPP